MKAENFNNIPDIQLKEAKSTQQYITNNQNNNKSQIISQNSQTVNYENKSVDNLRKTKYEEASFRANNKT